MDETEDVSEHKVREVGVCDVVRVTKGSSSEHREEDKRLRFFKRVRQKGTFITLFKERLASKA